MSKPGRVPPWGVVALGLLSVLELGLGILLVLESIDVLADDPGFRRNFNFLWWSGTLNTDTTIIILALGAGIVGGFIHTATSLVKYVGNRQLRIWWMPLYLLRAPIAAALAVLIYLLIRGGLFPGSAAGEEVSAHGVAALAGLAGMFSNKAVEKMEQVFISAFGTDTRSADSLETGGPTIRHVEWDDADPPSLLIHGSNFTDDPLAVVGAQVVGIDEEDPELLRIVLAEDPATFESQRVRVATRRGLSDEFVIPPRGPA